jgi:hypothetical protein
MESKKTNKILFNSDNESIVQINSPDKFNLYDYHFRSKQNILLSYKGPVNKHVLSIMSSYIKDLLSYHEKISKKIFKIFVELAQNISIYSEERNKYGRNTEESGVGTIVIIETAKSFHLITGNLLKTSEVEGLRNKCEHINKLDVKELRSYKRSRLELPDSEKGGANVGLIHVAITSENPLDYEISKIDENISFFTLSVKVDKN